MSNSPLANVIEVSTSLPVLRPDDTLSASSDRIGLRISSEFTTHIAPVTLVDGNHKLALVKDKNGQPLLFSVGNNNRLMCFAHEDGAREAWQSYDITPTIDADGRITTFDVTESDIHLVLAVCLPAGTRTKVFTSVCKKTEFNPSDVKWVDRSPGHSGPHVVSSLLCGGADAAGCATVTAGTEASATLAATYYQLDTDPSNDFPWVASPLPENAQRILHVAPGRLTGNLGVGYYALYSLNGGESTGCIFQKNDHSMKIPLQVNKLGKIYDIHSALTPYHGNTDLFAATERGIAYFSHFRPDKEPQILLPDISFRQVVAAEYGTQILVFAVSEERELYYLEGTRKSSIVFNYSGFPIRSGVEMLSVAYNTTAGATELMYIEATNHAIRHLWRDPVSFAWQEAAISVLSPKEDPSSSQKRAKTRSFPAYVTAITVVNDTTGEGIGSGYELSISSDLVYATINDSTYSLTKKPTKVKADSLGRITIIQEVNDSLSSPSYTLHLSSPSPEANPKQVDVPVHPAQRVIQQLSKYTTAESLAGAKTADGRQVRFGAGAEANFAGTAAVLGQFGSLVQTADPVLGKQLVPDSKPVSELDSIAFEVDSKGRTIHKSGDWLKDAVSTVAEFFGDIWETIKCGLRTAFKFAVNVIGKAVKVFVWIAGKIYSFVAHTVGPLLRSIAGFIKDTLGLDLNGFLDWLGFSFDWENIKKTQKHLVEFGTNLLGSMSDFFVVNRPVIEETMQLARGVLSDYIKDTRVPVSTPGKPDKPNPFMKLLGWIFNNPILRFLMKYNPITWLMGEVADIVGDDIRLPDISPLFSIITDILPQLLGDQFDIVSQFGQSFMDVLQRLITREIDLGTALKELLGDVFWSIFDSVSGVALAIFDAAGKFFAALFNVFTQEIKIPLMTDLWEALTDQPLTVMNVITLVPSFAMNTFFLAQYKKLPFDEEMMGSPSSYLPTKDQLKFPPIVDIAVGVLPPGLSDDVLVSAKEEIRRSLGVDIESAPLVTPPAPTFVSKGEAFAEMQSDVEISFQAPPLVVESSAMMSFQAPALKMQSMRFEEMKPDFEMSVVSEKQEILVGASVTHEDAKSSSGGASHDHHDENHPYHVGEVICGLIGSLLSVTSTGVEIAEAKAHHAAKGHGGGAHAEGGHWHPLKIAKVILGCLSCCNRFVSFCIMRATPDFDRSLVGKNGASRAVGIWMLWITKGLGFVFNAFEVYISFHPKTELVTAFLRVLANAVGCGVAGIIEFVLSHTKGAGPILRLIADEVEWVASAAGFVSVLGAEAKEPTTIAWALGTNGVLDLINVGLNIGAISVV